MLWRGLLSACVRAFPVNAMTFAMYEVALTALKAVAPQQDS